MRQVRAFWRQFVAWGTDFVASTEHDPYLRARLTFVVLLGLIGFITIVAMGVVIYLTLEETLAEITATIPELEGVLDDVEARTLTTLVYNSVIPLAFIVNGVIVLLGYLAARVSFMRIAEVIEAQRNFIAYTAHELRTPLAVARLTLETTMLEAPTLTRSTYTARCQEAIAELDSVAGIINNLVVLNTIARFSTESFTEVDLSSLARECVTASQDYAAQKELFITAHAHGPHWVYGNREALRQVISNLLRNAIKYTDAGAITVSVHTIAPTLVRLTVRDTGIGIPPHDLPHVFEPFFRSQSAAHRSRQGSGLGLALVGEMVKQHRGRIRIKSYLGVGTTITIDLATSSPPTSLGRPRRTVHAHSFTVRYGR